MNINKQILIEGLFAKHFSSDEDLEQQAESLLLLENQKKEVLKKNKPEKTTNYAEQWMELDSKYKLNNYDGDKMESYKTYRSIYEEKYELIQDYLHLVHKKYDHEEYDYLIRKI